MRPKLITSVRKNCRNFSGAATAHNTLVKTLNLADEGTRDFVKYYFIRFFTRPFASYEWDAIVLDFFGFDLLGEKIPFLGKKQETFSKKNYPLIYTTVC